MDKKNIMRFQFLSKTIKESRERCNLTQKQLAEKAGIGRTTIVTYETEVSNITIASLYAIADALDMPITDFFLQEPKESEEKESNPIGQVFAVKDATLELGNVTKGIGDEYKKK